jgi:hypothetical protein
MAARFLTSFLPGFILVRIWVFQEVVYVSNLQIGCGYLASIDVHSQETVAQNL